MQALKLSLTQEELRIKKNLEMMKQKCKKEAKTKKKKLRVIMSRRSGVSLLMFAFL